MSQLPSGGACAIFDGPVDGTPRGAKDTVNEWHGRARVPDGESYLLPIQKIAWASDGREDVVTMINAFLFTIGLPPNNGTGHLRLTITAISS